MLKKKVRSFVRQGISDFFTRCSRNWFPVLIVLGAFAPMAGEMLVL